MTTRTTVQKISRRQWAVAAGIVALAVVVHQIVQLHAALRDAHPTGDHAIFEINVRMVLEGTQRFGPYSQGFYHPGPAYFVWLATPYVVFGQTTFGLHVGAAALTALFLAGIAIGLSRWSVSAIPCVAFVPLVALDLAYLGDFPLFEYWPPYVLFLGYALFLVLCAGLASGLTAALPLVVVVGSFLVQTHIGYTLPVVGGLLVAIACALGLRQPPRAAWKWPAVVAAVCGVMLWMLPAYAELVEGARNTPRIVQAFADHRTYPWKPLTLINRVAVELTGAWQYAFFRDRFIVPEAPKHYAAARLVFALYVVGLALAWRRARRHQNVFAESLCLVCGLSIPIALFTLAQIRGRVAPHHTAWISSIGLVAGLGIAAALAQTPASDRRAWPSGARVLGIALAFLALSLIRPTEIIRPILETPEVGVLASSVARVSSIHEKRPVRIAWDNRGQTRNNPEPALRWATAVMLQLEKQHVPFFIDASPVLTWAIGRERWRGPAHTTAPTVYFTTGHEAGPGHELQCIPHGGNIFMSYPICASIVD